MNNKKLSKSEMVAKSKKKVLSCSTPEHHSQLDSPSRDSDSVCDSDAASPVPFLCTQDGQEGEIDVVWNYYTPNSQNKNSTPVRRRTKKPIRSELKEKPISKRRPIKPTQISTEFFQELIEINQNLQEFIVKKPKTETVTEKLQSEEDMFLDTSDSSPLRGIKSKKKCLRKNILSLNYHKAEQECFDSDDSMNECLLKASQLVEERILNDEPQAAKRQCLESLEKKSSNLGHSVNIEQNSMDAKLSNIKIESPHISKVKNSPKFTDDSFDSLLGNLNDSALERLSQMPVKHKVLEQQTTNKKDSSNWMLKEMVLHDGSPSSKIMFGRHNSMPESPTVVDVNKPSTSGMAFARYNSMPFNKSHKITVPGDSPVRCTPEENKKHQLAKRLLPFTCTRQSNRPTLPSQPKPPIASKKFQPKVPSSRLKPFSSETKDNNTISQKPIADDIKLIIEKNRQEALMKLRKRQLQNKSS